MKYTWMTKDKIRCWSFSIDTFADEILNETSADLFHALTLNVITQFPHTANDTHT